MKPIIINGISIDPSAPKPALAAMAMSNTTAKDSDYLVVQTKHPLTKAERDGLAKTGAEIIESVPGEAYICHFPKTDLAKVRALPFVEWAELYPRAVKLAPSLLDVQPQTGGVPVAAAMLSAARGLDDTRKTIDVVLHRNVNPRTAAKLVAEAAHLPASDVEVLRGKLRLTTKVRRLEDIAGLDQVR